MSIQEWGDISWIEQQIYIEGFRKEGILKDDGQSSPAPAPKPGVARTKKIDLTSADLSEFGDSFTVRRAG